MSAKVYRCAICGERSQWSANWRAWSSVFMEESIPGDIPTVCSDDCRVEFDRKMKSGAINVPEVKCRGYNSYKIIGKRKGY